MEAYNDTTWKQLESVVVVKKSKKATIQYPFEPKENIRAFRLTWIDNGENGVALDAFTATASQQIDFLYKGRELSLINNWLKETDTYAFGNLEPDNTYYYQIQATDLDKGCEEHLTELSKAVAVTTIAGKPLDGKQLTMAIDSINYNPAQHAIYVINPEDGDYLYFYNTEGGLVYSLPVLYGVYIYPLDLNRFNVGEVYLVQHAVGGKLGRKNKWAKFVF